jgi:hypothetical protein
LELLAAFRRPTIARHLTALSALPAPGRTKETNDSSPCHFVPTSTELIFPEHLFFISHELAS